MKFKADKNKLSEAIINASKACANKTAVSGLNGVHIKLTGHILTITGYDLEMGIRTSIKVDGIQDGEIVADAKLLSDMVKRMPGDSLIDIEVKDEKIIHVCSGKIKLKFQGTPGSNFPNISKLAENVNFKISEKVLKSILSQVHYAISQSDLSPALGGAKFLIENGEIIVVSSDGFRLALRREPLSTTEMEFIVPEKTVLELVRNLIDDDDDSDKKEEREVLVIVDRNQVSFSKPDYMIFSRIIEGKFVDFMRIIEIESTREIIVKVREFSDCLERSLLLINDRIKSPVICSFGEDDNNMHINCCTVIGTIDEDISVRMKCEDKDKFDENGEEIKYKSAFNPRFMLEALKNSGCDEVKIKFSGELNPIKIVPLSEDGFVFIVVPVRLT